MSLIIQITHLLCNQDDELFLMFSNSSKLKWSYDENNLNANPRFSAEF